MRHSESKVPATKKRISSLLPYPVPWGSERLVVPCVRLQRRGRSLTTRQHPVCHSMLQFLVGLVLFGLGANVLGVKTKKQTRD